jgi:copper oxidase (laccase) domain-containing protein
MNEFGEAVLVATSTRNDGNMDFRFEPEEVVIGNRTRFLDQFDIGYDEHLAMRCDHKDVISVVDRSSSARGARDQKGQLYSEVLVTQERHLALMLFTADCQSVSFFDPVTKTIALAHISRVTLLAGLPQKTIAFMQHEFRVLPQDLLVHIGPSIHPHSYTFLLPLEHTPAALAPYIAYEDGYAHIDLIGAHLNILERSGIRPDRITVSPMDTGTGNTYFSHHQCARKGIEDDGRHATILMMR